MAIVGLTVNESGEVLQRLAVTTKIAIGEVVKTEKGTRPNKLDHFVFLRKGAKTLEWEPDQVLMKHYGDECREVFIILLDDEIENVFRTELAWWSKTEKKCSGDGRKAWRRTEACPDGEDWTPCGDGCPDLEAGRCKPNADLHCVLADFPRLGSICRLHTTSYRSIRQIHSALEQIRTVTGGRLAGIRCKLVVRPEKATYQDAAGAKKTTTIYALSIELSAQDMQKLVGEMTQYAKLFNQTKKLLGDGRRYVIEDEAEEERAVEVAREFYPVEEIRPAAPVIQQPSRTSAAPAPEPDPAPAPAPEQADIWPKDGEKKSGNGVQYASAAETSKLRAMVVERGYTNVEAKRLLKSFWEIPDTAHIPAERYAEVWAYFDTKGEQKPNAAEKPYQATDEDLPF